MQKLEKIEFPKDYSLAYDIKTNEIIIPLNASGSTAQNPSKMSTWITFRLYPNLVTGNASGKIVQNQATSSLLVTALSAICLSTLARIPSTVTTVQSHLLEHPI